MKKGIHPENYREVAFKDVTANEIFILKSNVETTESIEHKGKEYPVFTVDASSKSHPFYTGNRNTARSAGRVEKFNSKFKMKK